MSDEIDVTAYLATVAHSTAFASTGIGLVNAKALARAGLLSPDDIEEMAHMVTRPFEKFSEMPEGESIRAASDLLLEPLAEIRILAQQNWKPSPP